MNRLNFSTRSRDDFAVAGPKTTPFGNESSSGDSQALAARITKAASTQTYYTIRFLVDRDLVADAYRAYAYFRWLDDWIDNQNSSRRERAAFVLRQKGLIECGYQGDWPTDTLPEERMVIDLIKRHPQQTDGLYIYLQNIMDVMAFDAERRGKLISRAELDSYSLHLATAVTEALHYFIGQDDPSPHTGARYLAATGAHIVHMLRDTYEDTATGYFNIPSETLAVTRTEPRDFHTGRYMTWVQNRVALARCYFREGKRYLAGVKNVRCRVAGYSYIARFERVLNTIARENYWLRPNYHELEGINLALAVGRSTFYQTLWSFTTKSPFLPVTEAD